MPIALQFAACEWAASRLHKAKTSKLRSNRKLNVELQSRIRQKRRDPGKLREWSKSRF